MKIMRRCLVMVFVFLVFQVTVQSQETIPEDITIDRDGILLKGKFYKAEGEGVLPTVILLQGSPGNPTDVIGLGKRLSQSGINTMTFNYSGTHQSQGTLSFENNQKDITEAIRFLCNPENITRFKIDTAFIILAGHSYGGGIAMTYAIKYPEIKRVISIAGNEWGQYFEDYTQNPELKKTTDASIEKAISSGIMRFEVGATPWEMAEAGLDKMDPDLYVRRNASMIADRDILIIGGWDDTGPTIERYILPLYRALKNENAQNVQIHVFQDDHSFGKSRDELAQVMIGWIKSVLERRKPE